MPSQPPGTAELIAREMTLAFKPLETLFASGNIRATLASLGLRLPDSLSAHPAFLNAISDVVTQCTHIPDLVTRLKNAIDNEDLVEAIKLVVEIGTFIANVTQDIETIAQELDSIAGSFTDVDANQVKQFALDLPLKLGEFLLIYHLEGHYPIFVNVLNLLGLVEYDEVAGSATDLSKPAYLRRSLRLDRIGDMFSNPANYLKQLYQWGDPSFDGKKLIHNIYKLLYTVGIPAIYKRPVNPADIPSLTFGFLQLRPAAGSEKGLQLVLQAAFDGGIDLRIPFIQSNWFLQLLGEASLQGGTGISVFPSGKIELIPPSGSVDGKLGLYFLALPPAGQPYFIILGQSGGSRVSCGEIRFGLATSFAWDSAANKAKGDFAVEASVKDCAIVLDMSKGDGFIAKLLSGVHVEAHFDLLAGISASKGFYFSGSSALEIKLPLHVELGPVAFEGLTVTLRPADGKIPVHLGADIKASLGPLIAVIQNIGMSATFSFPDDQKGNLGPVQLDVGFKPPNGVGLSIDTGVIKGGGFLYLDFDKGEYFGALELEFQGLFSMKAVGIINTKMPDGSNGFSLLIIITAEFTPIQLGFGFTLNGIGGLLGLNRTTKIDVLREGIKTNAIKSILFPEDVVANIQRIISDIKQVFPPYADHFIIGPMAKVGWGTPSIITLELGLLIEIPVPRIVILGVIKALLPEENAPLLRMQINFLGVIDFENKYISFDASLYDSRLLVFTLSGDMAFRLSWGDNPVFILSVGGFHPAFKDAPADLQHMTRLTISLLSGENPRISIECYFAVTSNTVQFGAKAELYAEAAGFNVYGYLGFDVLFQFDPFHFIASVYAGLALRRGTSVIMGIRLSGELSGPKPWDVKGEASFTILFFDITVSFHETWGDGSDEDGPEKIDIIQLLTEQVNDNRNWQAIIPDNNQLHVSIKKIETTDDKLIVHPFGVLTFSERLVPLELSIDKFGNKAPLDANRFEIKTTDPSLHTEPVREPFAPENFITLKDNEKLARPSFEQMKSGFKITGSSALQTPVAVSKSVDYELTYLRKKKGLLVLAGIYKYAKAFFRSNLKGTAVAKSSLSHANNRVSANAPQSVAVETEQFVVANTSDMKLHSSTLVAGSYAEAAQMQDELVRKNPALKGQVQVVSHYELNPN